MSSWYGIICFNDRSHIHRQISIVGFGVCCSVVLEEGGSSSLNQSYMVQTASTSLTTGSMQYTICPCSEDVCRIRFDFTVKKLIWKRFKYSRRIMKIKPVLDRLIIRNFLIPAIHASSSSYSSRGWVRYCLQRRRG